MSAMTWLGATVQAKQWPTQKDCYDACWHKCNADWNLSPIPGAPAGPSLVVEICAAKCFDDSNCASRPTSTTPILEWEPTDETLPPPKPKPVPPAPSTKPPQAPSASPTATPAPAQQIARRRSPSVVPALVGIALVGLLAYGVLS